MIVLEFLVVCTLFVFGDCGRGHGHRGGGGGGHHYGGGGAHRHNQQFQHGSYQPQHFSGGRGYGLGQNLGHLGWGQGLGGGRGWINPYGGYSGYGNPGLSPVIVVPGPGGIGGGVGGLPGPPPPFPQPLPLNDTTTPPKNTTIDPNPSSAPEKVSPTIIHIIHHNYPPESSKTGDTPEEEIVDEAGPISDPGESHGESQPLKENKTMPEKSKSNSGHSTTATGQNDQEITDIDFSTLIDARFGV